MNLVAADYLRRDRSVVLSETLNFIGIRIVRSRDGRILNSNDVVLSSCSSQNSPTSTS